MRTHLIRGAIALAVVLAVSAPAAAQQVLKGTVVDENGKPLEGAVITIQSTESNRRYDVTSDEGGEFVQIGLNSGEYNVLAEKSNMRQILPATVNRSRVAELAFELTEFSHLTPEKAKEQMEISAMADSATAALAADRHDEAILILTSLVEKFPGCTDCYFNLGIAYVKTNDFSGAEAAYKQAIDSDPGSANAYTGLANLYNQMKKFDLAQEASTKAAELAAGAGGAGGGRRQRALQPGRHSVELGEVSRSQGKVRGGHRGRPEVGHGALPARNGEPEPRAGSGSPCLVRTVPGGRSGRPEGRRGEDLRRAAAQVA